MTRTFTQFALALVVASSCLLAKTSGPSIAAETTGDALMTQGLHAYQRGAFEQALAAWKQASQLYERGGKVKDQSRALVHVSQASEAVGQVNQALQNLELALALAQQTQDRVWIATVLDNLGRTYLAARNTEAAMQHLTQALEMHS
jgi:tetratricopeptide (TPR) repeat protein